MEGLSLSAKLSVRGLVVGRYYRVTSMDDSGVTFEEVAIDYPVVTHAGVQEFGSLTVDWDRSKVHRDGKWHRMAPSVFNLLRLLASHPGRVFSYHAIKEYVWGHEVSDSSVTVLAKRLRYVVGDEMIETIRRAGLRLANSAPSTSQP
jgi:DNA-binding response OmpR family regulator